MPYARIKHLKKSIGEILAEIPETRNSDVLLMLHVWKKYHPGLIMRDASGHEWVQIDDIFKLPSHDVIRRIRAVWQNDKKLYPPTDLKVALNRHMEEDEWRVAMGYPTKETAGTEHPSYIPPSHQ